MELKQDTVFFGTYKLIDKDILIKALTDALSLNIKYFDFAELYKNQDIIGDFFQNIYKTSKLKRDDFYFTTKVSFRTIIKGEEHIRKSIDKIFVDLQTDYLDLVLIHAPTKNNILCWNILQEYKKANKIKNIGISNFNVIELNNFISEISDPTEIYCNQIEFNPFLNRKELIDLCKIQNIKLTCYGTLYKTNDFIDSLQEKYKKTTKQILIQFAIQSGLNPIIMAVQKEHIIEDFNYGKFIIDKEDFDKMNSCNENYSLYKRYL